MGLQILLQLSIIEKQMMPAHFIFQQRFCLLVYHSVENPESEGKSLLKSYVKERVCKTITSCVPRVSLCNLH